MVANYLFITSQIGLGPEIISARQVFEELMERGIWYLWVKTPYYKVFQAGDKALFYLSGKGNRSVVGSAIVADRPQPLTPEDESTLEKLGMPWFQFRLPLRKIEKWDSPVPIGSLVPNLDFITEKRNWGLNMRQGCRQITDSDYLLLMRAHDEPH